MHERGRRDRRARLARQVDQSRTRFHDSIPRRYEPLTEASVATPVRSLPSARDPSDAPCHQIEQRFREQTDRECESETVPEIPRSDACNDLLPLQLQTECTCMCRASTDRLS